MRVNDQSFLFISATSKRSLIVSLRFSIHFNVVLLTIVIEKVSILLQVWISYAQFELSLDTENCKEKARSVYKEGCNSLKETNEKEERLMLLENWKDYEVKLLILDIEIFLGSGNGSWSLFCAPKCRSCYYEFECH